MPADVDGVILVEKMVPTGEAIASPPECQAARRRVASRAVRRGGKILTALDGLWIDTAGFGREAGRHLATGQKQTDCHHQGTRETNHGQPALS
jgi:hypothetical protein